MINVSVFSRITHKVATLFVLALSLLFVANVANASKRVALVIGNSAYKNAAPLKNPRNDAEDLAAKLSSLGFDVVGGFDLDSRGFRDKVREFGEKLRGAEVAMFFYAGHALQVNGRNFLAPVNTDIRHEGDLDFETIPMDFVQRQMERETKTVLLFLDACRDNPLARNLRKSSRSTGNVRGLARDTNSSEGTFIAFATQPNNVALDGDGRNSPFTTALLSNIDRPGVEISTLMTDVRRQVFEATKEQQIPWINSSLLGRFYFKGGEDRSSENQVASLEKQSDTATDIRPVKQAIGVNQLATKSDTPVVSKKDETDKLLSMRLEQLAWEAVKDSKDTDELQAFVNAYGDGFFGDLARLRLARIKKAAETKVASLETRKIQVEKTLRDNPEDQVKTAVLKESETAHPKEMTRDATRQIQTELNRLGCVAGRPDGLWGKKSTRAVRNYAKFAKVQLATLQPTYDLLDQLRGHTSSICPAPRRVVKKQAKTCQAGQKLSRKGNCYWPKSKVRTRVKGIAQCQPGQQVSRNGNCFWPNREVQQQPGVIVQRRQPHHNTGQGRVVQQRQPQIIHQQRQPQIIQQQPPQRQNNGLLGGVIGGVIGCVLGAC